MKFYYGYHLINDNSWNWNENLKVWSVHKIKLIFYFREKLNRILIEKNWEKLRSTEKKLNERGGRDKITNCQINWAYGFVIKYTIHRINLFGN